MRILKMYMLFSTALLAVVLLLSTNIRVRKLQHLVAFNYKPEITLEQKQKVREAFD